MKQPPKVPDVECPHCGNLCEFDIMEDGYACYPVWVCWECDAIIMTKIDGSVPYWGMK